MKMQEGETIVQYYARIKDVVNSIRGSNRIIEDEIVIKKVLRTLLPIYAIRLFAIQELRCIPRNNLTLEVLVGRLTAFELSNYDNYKLESLESAFKAKFLLKYFDDKKQKKKRKIKHVSSENDTDEEDVEQLEALLEIRFHRGKGKYKGKLPIICFNCNEVFHIATICT